MALMIKNNATSQLAASLTSTATALSVTPGHGSRFPAPAADADWFPLTLIKADGSLEIVRCTGRTGDSMTIVRAQEGTAAQAFAANDRVSLRLTAAAMLELPINAGNLIGTVPRGGLAGTYDINTTGNAASATKLATPRAINGVNFDGTANITVADNTKLPTAGGTITGNLTVSGSVYTSNWYRTTGAVGWYSETYGGGIFMQDATWVRTYGGKSFLCAGTIASSGNIVAYYSDERLKENVQPIRGALAALMKINGVRYNANELAATFGYDRNKRELGLLVGEVESYFPELASLAPFDMGASETESLSGEHYKTLDYARMVPVLVEAIKELAQEVRQLKGEEA